MPAMFAIAVVGKRKLEFEDSDLGRCGGTEPGKWRQDKVTTAVVHNA